MSEAVAPAPMINCRRGRGGRMTTSRGSLTEFGSSDISYRNVRVTLGSPDRHDPTMEGRRPLWFRYVRIAFARHPARSE
jgi:hypothetical protein